MGIDNRLIVRYEYWYLYKLVVNTYITLEPDQRDSITTDITNHNSYDIRIIHFLCTYAVVRKRLTNNLNPKNLSHISRE